MRSWRSIESHETRKHNVDKFFNMPQCFHFVLRFESDLIMLRKYSLYMRHDGFLLRSLLGTFGLKQGKAELLCLRRPKEMPALRTRDSMIRRCKCLLKILFSLMKTDGSEIQSLVNGIKDERNL